MNIKKKWLRVEDSNLLHTELSLRYFKHAKFYLVNIASFIYCLFKPFLIVWLWRYCTFSDGSVVRLKYNSHCLCNILLVKIFLRLRFATLPRLGKKRVF